VVEVGATEVAVVLEDEVGNDEVGGLEVVVVPVVVLLEGWHADSREIAAKAAPPAAMPTL
jgi:hypothetical protein